MIPDHAPPLIIPAAIDGQITMLYTAAMTRPTTPIQRHVSLASTNAEAMRLGLSGVTAPLWVQAEQQTAGRGRSGKAWQSPPGNLYASLLVRLNCPPTAIHHLSFVAAVATLATIRRCAGSAAARLPLRLKWPNDILLDSAKLTGILPESTVLGRGGVLAVIGIGVNLAHAPSGLDRATTCLAAHGIDIAPAAFLDALDADLLACLALWDDGRGFAAIRARWLADGLARGTPMTVHTGNERIAGVFEDMAADGALILRDHSGYDRSLSFGDVTLDAAAAAEEP